MRVLISADKFKDCLSAEAVCEIIADEIGRLSTGYALRVCPLTDGGDGFASVLTSATGGILAGEQVNDPLGRPTQAAFGIVPLRNVPATARARLCLPEHLPPRARIAIIEMATASGLALLSKAERDPWQTDTVGTGQLLREAIRADVAAIVLGVGGSATNDLGLGALRALGYSFLDAEGNALRPCPANWQRIVRIEGSLPENMPPLRIACDVTNPLLGPQGASAVYAPQKGLPPADLPRMQAQAEPMGKLLCAHCGRDFERLASLPGAGAAGGIAFGLITALGQERARLVAGFELVADWLQLHSYVQEAEIVITGEGRFDASSHHGKGPGMLAAAALEQGKTVHVFAGQADGKATGTLHLHSITPPQMPLTEALAQGESLLRQAVRNAFSGKAPASRQQ